MFLSKGSRGLFDDHEDVINAGGGARQNASKEKILEKEEQFKFITCEYVKQ